MPGLTLSRTLACTVAATVTTIAGLGTTTPVTAAAPASTRTVVQDADRDTAYERGAFAGSPLSVRNNAEILDVTILTSAKNKRTRISLKMLDVDRPDQVQITDYTVSGVAPDGRTVGFHLYRTDRDTVGRSGTFRPSSCSSAASADYRTGIVAFSVSWSCLPSRFLRNFVVTADSSWRHGRFYTRLGSDQARLGNPQTAVAVM